MERPGVEELAPADLGAVDVGREEDPASHVCVVPHLFGIAGTRSLARRPSLGASSGSTSGPPRSPPGATAIWAPGSNRIVAAVVEVEVLGRELDREVLVERVEVAGHGPPPAPVVRGERQDARDVDRRRARGGRRGRRRPCAERVLGEQDQRVEHVLAIDLDDLELREQQLRERERRARRRQPVAELEPVAHLEVVDEDVDRATPRARRRSTPACSPNSALWRLSAV